MAKNGIILFLRYAYAAMMVGACGPEKLKLRRQIKMTLRGTTNNELSEEILRCFPVATSFLRMMAKKLKTPAFSLETIRAYWLCDHQRKERAIVLSHNSLVFDKITMGLKTNPQKESRKILIKELNDCIISTGVVVSFGQKQRVVVKTKPYVSRSGKLIQIPNVTQVVKAWQTKKDFRINDFVSLHHGWICESITKKQKTTLDEANTALVKRFNNRARKLKINLK